VILIELFSAFAASVRVRWAEYCARKAARGTIALDLSSIEVRKVKPHMPWKSPHWKTAPYMLVGSDRLAQFVVCNRCGYRDDEIVKRDRRCQRMAGRIGVETLRRCDGTLKGAITAPLPRAGDLDALA
jgi:hypothetical protein